MIDGLLLLLELGLLLVLLRTVWQARQKGCEDDLGFFAFKPELEPPPDPRPPGGLRPAPRPAPANAPGAQAGTQGPPHA